MRAQRICLVTPGHLASNPRIVKEADALHEAGYEVRVVYGDTTPSVASLDDTLIARAPWSIKRVSLGHRLSYFTRRLRQELARRIYYLGGSSVQLAVSAHSVITPALSNAAAAVPADLFIAHYLAALPAVFHAARRHKAKMGFDAEDDHLGEIENVFENNLEFNIRRRIEARFIAECRHLTAASPGIADAYSERYGVEVVPILNVFPLNQAPQIAAIPAPKEDGGVLSVYWFSQTIGPGRGLEAFIVAMSKTNRRIRFFVRGSDHLGYSVRLKALAAESGVGDSIFFLSSASPDEMVRLAAGYDVGLASELNTPPNHAICLSNKIFTYLLAGIPVLLSNTPAQRRLATELGDAAQLIDLNMPEQIAKVLDGWVTRRDDLAKAKYEAALLARTKFNWDFEKHKLLASVKEALRKGE